MIYFEQIILDPAVAGGVFAIDNFGGNLRIVNEAYQGGGGAVNNLVQARFDNGPWVMILPNITFETGAKRLELRVFPAAQAVNIMFYHGSIKFNA